eukprot:Gregarina_sp_Pseudo_9__2585@NODE_284_length_3295_cov_40_243857_g266_i0_p3_GENE_NODE_284_length_3295_cov_40_243857_g266_i0NODE_284_length_3295_cov_40_243857_g266_i0_p3_ORF_typecomplete_len177_score34_28Vps54_N/PF10475_9/0_0094DUF445/PF04286_12/0_015Nucleocap_ssRNA/PF11128_8/0_14Nucleocap_ssRNA/PF11128_8/6_1e02HrcA/PF01628_21/94HrcA/PF01628_21/7_4e02HrcA/PF01628_21/1PARP_reg/PF02877_14/2_3e02PARP_reg/PF02877_14/4_7e03PARP_reg/PF02877_14/0_77DUF416/PF04222_12/2DUF416/PF04222_12/82_NODE_284_length_3
MEGISKISNSVALLQVIETVDSLVNATEVQEKLQHALDTHELVKALNRVTGSHDALSPRLLDALEACRKFCHALQPANLAQIILDQHRTAIISQADEALAGIVEKAIDESVRKYIAGNSDVTNRLSELSKQIAEEELLLEKCNCLSIEDVETPAEALVKQQLSQCADLLETISSSH